MEKLLTADLIKKYYKQIFIIMSLFVGVALTAAFTIKPRYKVTSVISISPSYFQNSLMREFLSEVYDPAELRSQRSSIMSAALDKKFLDQMASENGVDLTKETSSQAAERRMIMLSSIDIVSTQASEFQISVFGNNREAAMKFNQKVIDNIMVVLKEKRIGMLTNLRSAVAAQIETMSPNIEVPATHETQLLRVASLEAQIADLSEKFSSKHPQVLALQKQLTAYRHLSAKSAGNDGAVANYNIKDGTSKTGSVNFNTVYDDLIRKLRYINIVISAENTPTPSYFSIVRTPEYPLGAVWPKKTLFLVWSLLLGVLTSLVYIAVVEIGLQKLAAKKKKSDRNLHFVEDEEVKIVTTKAETEKNDIII